ncbi:MAG: SGNH/GDSL hydrolase family protein, partial [bacterium]|nr:SGNH/GDSL hydrolase family protein [bacterium]
EWTGRAGEREIRYRPDENGFRNPRGIDRADLVFVGDSFTEGHKIAEQDTFPRLAEKATGLRTANLGRSGYGPPQELIVLQRHGLPLRPRFVIWQVFEGNDLHDTGMFRRWERNPGQASHPLHIRYLRKSLIRSSLKQFLSLDSPWTTSARITYPDGVSHETAFWGQPAYHSR